MPQTSIGVMDEWDEAYPGHRFHYAMQRIVVAARAAGVRALDGPVADYRDEEGLRKSCLVARSLGFDGKWCIHPAQIEPVNEVFSPAEREVEWAKKVVAAYEEANAAGSRLGQRRRADGGRRLDQDGPEHARRQDEA